MVTTIRNALSHIKKESDKLETRWKNTSSAERSDGFIGSKSMRVVSDRSQELTQGPNNQTKLGTRIGSVLIAILLQQDHPAVKVDSNQLTLILHRNQDRSLAGLPNFERDYCSQTTKPANAIFEGFTPPLEAALAFSSRSTGLRPRRCAGTLVLLELFGSAALFS